jgi:acetylornithine/succinyldiaminopimelate/putrescine aminotransferase/predicted amino acid dehydrogenase
LVRARTGRATIVAAAGSFHGKTLGALAATGQPHHAAGFGALPPGFAHVPFGDAEALATRLAVGDVAAVLLEPIQGERGVFVPPAGYLRRARELCTQHGAALVLDEIQTGLGRTGPLFAGDAEGVTPDLMLVAKGLGGGLMPLGALLVAAPFWDEHFALAHSSTFANNNLACRVGLAVLDELDTLTETARKGERLLAGLRRIAARYGRAVAEVRGRGLLCALELRPSCEGLFLSYLAHQGLYAYAVAATLAERCSVLLLPTLGEAPVLRVAPPLIITDEQIDLIVDALESVCAQLDRGAADVVARALGAFEPPPARERARVTLPLPAPPAPPRAHSYGFLVHYTQPRDVLVTDPSLARVGDEELASFRAYVAELPAGVVLRAPPVRSPTGAVADGVIMALPWLPADMARLGRRRVGAEIERAVDLCARLGAGVVGLGGYTTPYSRRGLAVAGRGPAITTGNTLTAAMAVAAARRAVDERGLDFSALCVGVVGARGSVGALAARRLAHHRPRRLILVGNPQSGTAALAALGRALPCEVEVTTDVARLAACELVLTAAAGARPALAEAPLRPGAIVCDVARPPDVPPEVRARRDLTVLDGGLVALPEPTLRFGAGNLQGLPDGVQLACLGETLLMALEGESRDRGLGDDIPVEEIDQVLALAVKHGFRLPAAPRARAAEVRP